MYFFFSFDVFPFPDNLSDAMRHWNAQHMLVLSNERVVDLVVGGCWYTWHLFSRITIYLMNRTTYVWDAWVQVLIFLHDFVVTRLVLRFFIPFFEELFKFVNVVQIWGNVLLIVICPLHFHLELYMGSCNCRSFPLSFRSHAKLCVSCSNVYSALGYMISLLTDWMTLGCYVHVPLHARG